MLHTCVVLVELPGSDCLFCRICDEVGVSQILRDICCCCPAGDVEDDGGDEFIEY